MRVHSSNFYVPALLLRVHLEFLQRFSNIVFRWLTMLSCVIKGHRYCQDRSVVLGEDSLQTLQSSLSYEFSSTLSFLQLVFPLLLVSRKRPLSHISLVSYHAMVSCHFLYRPTTCHNHFSIDSVQRTRTLEQESGSTLYLLEQGQRRRKYNSSPFSCDHTRTTNNEIFHTFQLNNNTNHDSTTRTGLAFLLDKKVVHFVRSICSPILSCLWKFLQDHTGLHHQNRPCRFILKKKSVSCSCQVNAGSTKRDWTRGDVLLRISSCSVTIFVKTFVANSRDFIWWFYLPLRCYKLADERLCITILSLIETTSPSFPLVLTT